jgi:hypothetical protein
MTAYERKLEWIESLRYLDLFGYASAHGVIPYLYIGGHRNSNWRPMLPIWKDAPEYSGHNTFWILDERVYGLKFGRGHDPWNKRVESKTLIVQVRSRKTDIPSLLHRYGEHML